jgi:hypothetical protein
MSKKAAHTELSLQHAEKMRKLQRHALDQIEHAVMGATTLPAAKTEVRLILDALHRAHMEAETVFRKKKAAL